MQNIKIITDSCSDLSPEMVNKYDIEVIPTPVTIGKDKYYDREDISPEEFYRKITENEFKPLTSRINPVTYQKAYNKYLSEYDHLLVICFSSALSGIFESAVLAKNMQKAKERITVIDSKAASFGLGLSVIKAARMIESGDSLAEILEQIKYSCSHMQHIFAVGSLEMLKRGGRISSGQAFIGNILNIKPILHIQDGEILPLDKVRGKTKMYKYLLELMQKRGIEMNNQLIGLSYAGDLSETKNMINMIFNEFDIAELLSTKIGAAVGSHVGSGTIAIYFVGKEKIADIVIK